MKYNKHNVLRWSVVTMVILLAFALGCGNTAGYGNLIDPTSPELLLGNSGVQRNSTDNAANTLDVSSVEPKASSPAVKFDNGTVKNSQAPITQTGTIPEQTSTPEPPVAESVSISANSSPSGTGNSAESSVTVPPVLIASELSSTIIKFSLSSRADSSSIGHGEPVLISVMVDAGDHDIRGVDITLKYDPNMLQILNLETGDFLVDETFEFIAPVVGLRSIDDKAGLIEFAAAKVGDNPLAIKSGELVRIVGVANKNLVTDNNLMSLSSVRIAGASGDQIGFIIGGVDLQGWQ